MIIGVDAGMLSQGDQHLKTGVYRVAVNLLRELGRIDTTNTYRLYSFAPIDKEVLRSFGPMMKNVVLTPMRGWFTVRLPLELYIHPVDVFLGFAQALPRCRGRKIGFVYDLGFLRFPSGYPASSDRLTRLTNELIARADHIVTISQASKQDIVEEYHVRKNIITVIPLGADHTFTPHGNTVKRKHPYFLFVGVLKPGKNIPFLINAFGLFLARQKNIYDLLLIGGDDWLDPDIDRTIKKLNLERRVQRLGFVDDKELPAYYRGATAFVSPSLIEGFCLPAVEAMASGCPVMVSDIPVMKEIVGNAGIFIDPTDTDECARALQSVLVSDRRRKLRSLGFSRAKMFSWKKSAEIVHALLYKH